MSTTLAELAAMRERCDAALPGPWYQEVDGWPVRNVEGGNVAAWDKAEESDLASNPYHPMALCFDTLAFIAHARQDMPRLLDMVAERAARIQELELALRVGYKAMDNMDCALLGFVELDDMRDREAAFETVAKALREGMPFEAWYQRVVELARAEGQHVGQEEWEVEYWRTWWEIASTPEEAVADNRESDITEAEGGQDGP